MRKFLKELGIIALVLYAISRLSKPKRKEESLDEQMERLRLASSECSGLAEDEQTVA